MKIKLLTLIIASTFASQSVANEMSLNDASVLVMDKMAELATLATQPENVSQEGEQKYLHYKGKKLRINYDGNIKFGLMGFQSEFETVFDFLPTYWEKEWYDGGFDIFPDGVETWQQCHFSLVPAARGSMVNGNYIWERVQSTELVDEGCREKIVTPSVLFNTNEYPNMLTGELSGAVLFAQAHVVPAKSDSDEKRMHLVGNRKTKLMFKPEVPFNPNTDVLVTAKDRNNLVLGQLEMLSPELLARNVLAIPELNGATLDFSYDSNTVVNVRDLSSEAIATALAANDVVKLNTWNGHWVKDIKLEQNNPALDGKIFIMESEAGYNSVVHYYQERTRTIVNGTTTVFKNVNGAWIVEDDLLFNDIGYAEGFWSVDLPKAWMEAGLSLTFSNQGKTGDLSDIKVGAPTELLLHTIDVGMLVEPRGRFDFQRDKAAQREYFETAPVSKMVVSEYEPVHLTEVMLPDGTLLTDFDPSEGGWHGGTMRQRIGKELISIGINNANYGIHSTAGVGEGEHPYFVAQLTAHNTRGRYSNGVVTHGGSGGGGIVTLDSSIGNEFSHEVGHNYGLWHYPGGFEGSIHKPSTMTNSSWGWDSSRDVFIPNFNPNKNGGASCLDGQCVPAFNEMFSFGFDSMAGGSAMYGQQRFTMYSPYSMFHIQQNLESKAVFDPTSSTGFRKWDQETETMEEYTHQIDALEVTNVQPWEANAERIAALFASFDKVQLSTWNGHWARDMSVPDASLANKGKIFTFNSDAGYHSNLTINGASMVVPYGSRLTFVSDGETWVQDGEYAQFKARKPAQFGVAVTTLVGYYDPSQQLESFIFPALHGSYGYVYSDDGAEMQTNCALEVEMADGSVAKYALKNNRRNASVMNKFHVNVAREDEPQVASVICNGEVLDTMTIAAPTLEPVYTVQGEESLARAFSLPLQPEVPRVAATPYALHQCDSH